MTKNVHRMSHATEMTCSGPPAYINPVHACTPIQFTLTLAETRKHTRTRSAAPHTSRRALAKPTRTAHTRSHLFAPPPSRHQSPQFVMSLIGELPTFYSGHSDWQVYTERLEQFFEVNDIADDKKKALLLTSVGEDVYKTLRDVCHPQLPKSKTFDELIELLNKQFVVRTSVFRERVKFYTARQYANESIAQWYARLKKLSLDCKFGERFDAVLMDRFVSGLRPGAILDRLCEEDGDELTVQRALEIASNKESSAKGAVGGSGGQEADDDGDEVPEECGGRKRGGGRGGRGRGKH